MTSKMVHTNNLNQETNKEQIKSAQNRLNVKNLNVFECPLFNENLFYNKKEKAEFFKRQKIV